MFELHIPISKNVVVRVPYPMTEEDFDLLISTLQLWRKKISRPVGEQPAEEQ